MRDVGMLYFISICWVFISALIVLFFLYLCVCVFQYLICVNVIFDIFETLQDALTKIHTNIIAKNITRSATFLNFHCLNQLVKAGGGSRACSLQLSNHLVCSDHPSHAFPGQQGIPQFPRPHPRQQGIPH